MAVSLVVDKDPVLPNFQFPAVRPPNLAAAARRCHTARKPLTQAKKRLRNSASLLASYQQSAQMV